jgi:hypothetical protein
VLHRDLRAPKKTTKRWQLSENKIGCISVNPADDTMFVTAHLNRDMRCASSGAASVLTCGRIYDARKLTAQSTDNGRDELYEACCVSEYSHEKACCMCHLRSFVRTYAGSASAYFDWEGKRILSTSYDNTMRSEFLLKSPTLC